VTEQLQPYLDAVDADLRELARRAALPASALWRPRGNGKSVPPVDQLQAWLDRYVDLPVPSGQTSWLHDALVARARGRRPRHTPGPAVVTLLLRQP